MKKARDTIATASRLRVAYGARRCGARHRGRTDQGVDLLTNPATGAMQENALVLGADFQQRARLLGVAAFHVTQQDDRSLAGRKPVDHRLNVIPDLATAHDPLGIKLVPQPGSLSPVTVGFELGERHAAFVGSGALHQSAQSDEATFAGEMRVRARFVTILKIQVTRLERSSNFPTPEHTASHESCTTSSAWA